MVSDEKGKKPVKRHRAILRNMTVVVGSGRLGSSIASRSCERGRHVVVIDNDNEGFNRLSDNFSGYEIRGDATDLTILEAGYIKKAREIIVTTGDDNVNIFVAHLARIIYDVPEVYIRLDDPSKDILIRGMNIKAIYPFQLSIDKFDLLRRDDEGAKKP